MSEKEVTAWLKATPFRLRRELVEDLRRIADQMAADIRAETPEGATGALKNSVRVRRGRNTLELYVEAGGEKTTKEVRAGSRVAYDYSLAVEFGTSKMVAQPFFYTTYRKNREEYQDQIAEAVGKAVGRL